MSAQVLTISASTSTAADVACTIAWREARAPELIQDLAHVEGARGHPVDDFADGLLAVDRVEHRLLHRREIVRLSVDGGGVGLDRVAEIEASLDEAPLVHAAEAFHHDSP